MHNVVHHLLSSDILSDCAVRAESLHNWVQHPAPASRLLGKACFHIAPVVFCYITIGQIISITFGLPVTAMSTLEHIKVEPVGIIEPGCRHGSTNGWKVIKCSYRWNELYVPGFPKLLFSHRLVYLLRLSTLYSDCPYIFRQGRFRMLSLLLHPSAHFLPVLPRYIPYLYIYLCFQPYDDIIHMVPITIYSFFINMAEIESVRHGILSIDIHRGNSI